MDKAATHFAVTSLPFDEVVIMLLSATKNPINFNKKKQNKKSPYYQRPPPSSSSLSSSSNAAFHIQPDVDISELDLYLADEGTISALRIYLQEKLRMLHVSYKSQRTMIATWLCEIYIHMIAVFEHHQGRPTATAAASAGGSGGGGSGSESKLLKMFKDFLRNHRGTLDAATTISLLVSRGPEFRPILLFYCQIVGDYERVLSQSISEGKYSEAIVILQNSPIEKVEGLIYKKAPVLMEHHPEMAIELFLSKKYLRIIFLLPALYRYSDVLDRQYAAIASNPDLVTSPNFLPLDEDSNQQKVNFAIYYLEEVLSRSHSNYGNGNQLQQEQQHLDPSISHTLLFFLAKYDSENEEKLLNLLRPLVESSVGGGDYNDTSIPTSSILLDKTILNYQYILRICQRYQRKISCIYIYVLMNLFEKAVQLALLIDLNFAKTIASYAMDYHVSKKLWISIIDHIISKSNANQHYVQDVLDVLRESNGLIRIEVPPPCLSPDSSPPPPPQDILDKLPDFTEIDLFKEEIYKTLEDYASRVESMKEEMEELSNSAEVIEEVSTQSCSVTSFPSPSLSAV
jgi:vacuolar protein sorting-associated protein 18